jgi:hypothetical protein
MPRNASLVDGDPVPPVGGRVLTRALLSAFNRVPGRVGRYNVTLAGEYTVLSEFLATGEAPFMAFGPQCLQFFIPPCVTEVMEYGETPIRGVSAADIRRGWPFTRHSAVLRAIGTAENPPIIWSRPYCAAVFQSPPGRSRDTARMAFSAGVFTMAEGQRRFLYTNGLIRLNPTFAGTYYGARNLERMTVAEDMSRLNDRVAEYFQATRSDIPSQVTRALRAIQYGSGSQGPDVLALVSPEPEMWNSETDPGGDGDPTGAENGREVDDIEFDDDGEPVERPRRGPAVTRIPGDIPASSFADWESRALPSSRELYVANRDRLNRELVARYIVNDEAVNPDGCSHCRGEDRDDGNPSCSACDSRGRCMSCGGPWRRSPTGSVDAVRMSRYRLTGT